MFFNFFQTKKVKRGSWPAILFCLLLCHSGKAEVIDCVVAIVNNQVITLTDLRILDAFGLHESGMSDNRYLWILEREIDQKVMMDLTQEKLFVEKEIVDEELQNIKARLGQEAFQEKLQEFGLKTDDLRTYLEEKILCQRIIDLRFSQSAAVSLKEIEAYYNETYLPLQKKLGLEPRPMLELLDEIESRIKKEKIKIQVDSWIKNLRQQAEVEVKWDCFKKIEQTGR